MSKPEEGSKRWALIKALEGETVVYQKDARSNKHTLVFSNGSFHVEIENQTEVILNHSSEEISIPELNNWKIKPPDPKFKVGDLVVSKPSGILYKIIEVLQNDKENIQRYNIEQVVGFRQGGCQPEAKLVSVENLK